MAVNAIDAINVARSLLGTHGRPNVVSRWYAELPKQGDVYLEADWCAMQISYALFHSGDVEMSLIGGPKAYVPFVATFFENNGGWHNWKSNIVGSMQAGDLVIYGWDGKHQSHDHIGIVERVLSGGQFYSLEGDEGTATVSGGQSARIVRDATFVTGFGRPKWGTVSAPVVNEDSKVLRHHS